MKAFGKSLQKVVRRNFSKQFKAPGRIHMENGRIAFLLMGGPKVLTVITTSRHPGAWGRGYRTPGFQGQGEEEFQVYV